MQITSPLLGLRKLRLSPWLPLLLTSAIGLNLAQWMDLAFRVPHQANPIPLHYSIAFGIDRIGPWYGAYVLPISGTLMLLGNVLISALLADRQRSFAVLILILTVYLEAILLAGALLIFRPL